MAPPRVSPDSTNKLLTRSVSVETTSSYALLPIEPRPKIVVTRADRPMDTEQESTQPEDDVITENAESGDHQKQ